MKKITILFMVLVVLVSCMFSNVVYAENLKNPKYLVLRLGGGGDALYGEWTKANRYWSPNSYIEKGKPSFSIEFGWLIPVGKLNRFVLFGLEGSFFYGDWDVPFEGFNYYDFPSPFYDSEPYGSFKTTEKGINFKLGIETFRKLFITSSIGMSLEKVQYYSRDLDFGWIFKEGETSRWTGRHIGYGIMYIFNNDVILSLNFDQCRGVNLGVGISF